MDGLLLTDVEVAAETGISVSALRKARMRANRKRFRVPPHVKIGGRVRYRLVDVIPFLRPSITLTAQGRVVSRGFDAATQAVLREMFRRYAPEASAAQEDELVAAVSSRTRSGVRIIDDGRVHRLGDWMISRAAPGP